MKKWLVELERRRFNAVDVKFFEVAAETAAGALVKAQGLHPAYIAKLAVEVLK